MCFTCHAWTQPSGLGIIVISIRKDKKLINNEWTLSKPTPIQLKHCKSIFSCVPVSLKQTNKVSDTMFTISVLFSLAHEALCEILCCQSFWYLLELLKFFLRGEGGETRRGTGEGEGEGGGEREREGGKVQGKRNI